MPARSASSWLMHKWLVEKNTVREAFPFAFTFTGVTLKCKCSHEKILREKVMEILMATFCMEKYKRTVYVWRNSRTEDRVMEPFHDAWRRLVKSQVLQNYGLARHEPQIHSEPSKYAQTIDRHCPATTRIVTGITCFWWFTEIDEKELTKMLLPRKDEAVDACEILQEKNLQWSSSSWPMLEPAATYFLSHRIHQHSQEIYNFPAVSSTIGAFIYFSLTSGPLINHGRLGCVALIFCFFCAMTQTQTHRHTDSDLNKLH